MPCLISNAGNIFIIARSNVLIFPVLGSEGIGSSTQNQRLNDW